uniref:DUF1279 domain-containing protein n=1 Tax=Cairina moschata TaxID=8855 RepID=A0A8C3CKD7_CAIMO
MKAEQQEVMAAAQALAVPPGTDRMPGAGPPLSPPDPLLALQAAGGSSAKDVGGSPEKAATDLSGENKKLNKSQQLNKVFKEYGAVGVSFHIGISSVSLGISYLAVSSGVDMTAVLCKLGFSESSLQSKRAAGTGTFVITIVYIGLFKSPAPNNLTFFLLAQCETRSRVVVGRRIRSQRDAGHRETRDAILYQTLPFLHRQLIYLWCYII